MAPGGPPRDRCGARAADWALRTAAVRVDGFDEVLGRLMVHELNEAVKGAGRSLRLQTLGHCSLALLLLLLRSTARAIAAAASGAWTRTAAA